MVKQLKHNIALSEREKETMERLDAITEISQHMLETLFAETRWDLKAFPDAAHLATQMHLCPFEADLHDHFVGALHHSRPNGPACRLELMSTLPMPWRESEASSVIFARLFCGTTPYARLPCGDRAYKRIEAILDSHSSVTTPRA